MPPSSSTIACSRVARVSAQTGGRGAIEEVIAAARGLADVIWSREVEGGSFATPERRAALEARINELSRGIRDEVVRRYYRQDLAEPVETTRLAPVPIDPNEPVSDDERTPTFAVRAGVIRH